MAERLLRGVIVGASSLLGRELAEELNQSPLAAWDLSLLDAAETGGRIASAGDEALVIQPVTAEAFNGKDVVFFAGDEATAKKFWKTGREAGASVVDLTGALEGLPGVLLHSPWTRASATDGSPAHDRTTVSVRVPHPAALMLGIAAERLRHLGLRRLAATVLEPASQQGSAGVEELQDQTVALLSFKPMVQDVFGAQVAFNLRAALGGRGRLDLAAVAARIEREAAEMAGRDASAAIAVQVLQAPVFHGSTASVFVELGAKVEESAVRDGLSGDAMRVLPADESGSNESVSGSGDILVTVRSAAEDRLKGKVPSQRPSGTPDTEAVSAVLTSFASLCEQGATGSAFWLWMAADNLRLVARSAAASGAALAAMRA